MATPRLQQKYREEVIGKIQGKFGIKNVPTTLKGSE